VGGVEATRPGSSLASNNLKLEGGVLAQSVDSFPIRWNAVPDYTLVCHTTGNCAMI
jgi:hypothetical protein